MLRKSQLLSAAQIEAQLRAQVGDAAFDAIPNAAPARTEPQPRLPRPERCRSPQRQASIERRRRIVASGPLPPQIAARFTWGEVAALAIVGNEVKRSGGRGVCMRYIEAMAAMAGVRRTTMQNALRKAKDTSEGRAIIEVEHRRRDRNRNLSNIVRIVSPEWLTWLRRARPAAFHLTLGVGSKCTQSKKLSTTDTSKKEEAAGKIKPAGPNSPLENVLQSWGRVVDTRRST